MTIHSTVATTHAATFARTRCVRAHRATRGSRTTTPTRASTADDRDDAVSGCTECSLPNESARAETTASLMALATNGHSRALVVGAETGALCEALVRGGETALRTVLCVDASSKMLDRCAERLGYGEGGALQSGENTLGNTPGVRFLRADDMKALKPYHGAFDAVAFNAHLVDRGDADAISDALTRVLLLCKPGARVIISERAPEDGSQGFDFAEIVQRLPLALADSARPGKDLKSQAAMYAIDDDNPLALVVPNAFALSDRMTLEAPVVTGFGRGSKQMGVPTANLDPELCGGEEFLSTLPLGVYFGWAKLQRESEWHECVLNVGKRPTFVDGDGTTIEVHVMGASDAEPEYADDFYGETMRVDVCGYIRPEMRFESLPELVARIKTDIGLARNALASGSHPKP